MENQLLDQFGSQHCGVFLGVESEDLDALRQWLRLVDFHCEWVWGDREPCWPGAGPYECAVSAGVGAARDRHVPAVRTERISFRR